MDINHNFWNNILLAVETVPTEQRTIVGRSGLSHHVLAMGVDTDRNRIVIVSADPDARTAVLAREDIQAKYPDQKVVLTRPLPFTLSPLAEILCQSIGSQAISLAEITARLPEQKELDGEIRKSISPHIDALIGSVTKVPVNFVAVFQEAIAQLGLLKFNSPIVNEDFTIQLTELLDYDVARQDRIYGNCPFPLFEITGDMHEELQKGDVEQTKYVLDQMGVLPYFFPNIDEVALGVTENLKLSETQLIQAIDLTPTEGHPLAQTSLLEEFRADPLSFIQQIKSTGYLMEVEEILEITSDGQAVRSTIRTRPQEGTISKIARLISIKLDIKWPPT